MSNPVQAAILHDKRLNSIRDEQVEEPKTSILIWTHWEDTLPEIGKMVVISNEQNILLAKRLENNKWRSGIVLLNFDDFPLWSNQPSFVKTAKKTAPMPKNVLNLPKPE